MRPAEVSAKVSSLRGYSFIILHAFPDPDLEKVWRECLTRVEVPSHYNSPEFFMEPFWEGKRPFAILAVSGRRVVGVLTGLHEADEVVCGLSSRPQICFDKTADRAAATHALARGLLDEASSAKLVTVYSWIWTPLEALEGDGFRVRKLEGNVVLDLSKGSEALFKEFRDDRRRNIRFASRQGLEVFQADTPDDLLSFYQVYLGWRRTARKKIVGEEVPFPVFEQAFCRTSNRVLFLARFSGKVVAANSFRFYLRGLFESASNCSLQEFLYLKPNDLLQWKGIEWACSHGLVRHSLGGAHTFLTRFGGEVVPVYRYRLDRSWLRQHDLREAVLDWGRKSLRKTPRPIESAIRRILGRS